ncbi:MAG: DUF3179 domain-containing protein [Actinobacteria bacterium]|nr:DUF3179 domain-containing protein [Actinomycetota bacterium]
MGNLRLAAIAMTILVITAACGDSDSSSIDAGEVASALDDPEHDSFPPALIDVDLVISGGPPPDGIPPIDQPNYAAIEDIDFLTDTEPVVVLDINGDVRAFPLQIMTWHEIVNDTIGDVPVTISFCPLCTSAIAFERTINGEVNTFGTSGQLFNSSLVMYDRLTETLWTHFDGRAVIGALTGTELTKRPMQTVSWASFKESFPDGIVLTRDTGFGRNYGQNPYPGYDAVGERPFLFVGEIDGQLAAKERVLAVRGEETKVLQTSLLAEVSTVTFQLDGVDVVALHTAGTSSALDTPTLADGRDVGATGVFIAAVAGEAVDLTTNNDGTFTDSVSGSNFDIFGLAIDGPLVGSQLDRVEALDTFWFAIAAFTPDAEIIDVG